MAVMAVMNRSRGHGVHRALRDGHVAQVDLTSPGETFSITSLLGGSSYIVFVGYNPSYSMLYFCFMNGIGLIHLYHLVMTNSLLLKMTIEIVFIVDFPMKHGDYYAIPSGYD